MASAASPLRSPRASAPTASLGVHGPRELLVVVLEEKQDPTAGRLEPHSAKDDLVKIRRAIRAA